MTVICCLYCGMTAIDLPVDHRCRPNLGAADLAQLAREAARPKVSLADIIKARRNTTLDGAS